MYEQKVYFVALIWDYTVSTWHNILRTFLERGAAKKLFFFVKDGLLRKNYFFCSSKKRITTKLEGGGRLEPGGRTTFLRLSEALAIFI